MQCDFAFLTSVHKLVSRCLISTLNIFAPWENEVLDFIFSRTRINGIGLTLRINAAAISHRGRHFINYSVLELILS